MTRSRTSRRYRPALEALERRDLPAFTALGLGSTGTDAAQAITMDAAGDIYVTGSFQGTVDFDPGPGVTSFTSVGADDIFVAKYSAAGALIWARQMGGAGSDIAYDVAVDAANNVYLTGSFRLSVDFDPGAGTFILTSAGADDIFVVKLDSGGNFTWAGAMGGVISQHGFAVAVDGSGDVYVTGDFDGNNNDFDPGPGTVLLSHTTGYDIFILKLDSAGGFVWVDAIRGSGVTDAARDLALDSSGNVVITGYFSGTADFDPGAGTLNLTTFGSGDVFVAKVDPAGALLWVRQMGGSANDGGYGLVLDAADNVYLTGDLWSTGADFDPGAGNALLSTAGGRDIFVARLDAAGNYVWAQQMGGAGSDYGSYITTDASGNLYLTGNFSSTTDFDPGAGTFNLASAGGTDIFVARLDNAGGFVTAGAMGGGSNEVGAGLAIDAQGRIFAVGAFAGTADLAPGPGTFNLISAGGADIFLAQLPGVIVNESTGSTAVTEDSTTDTFTVVLDWLPTADVVVTLTPDAQLSLSATTLTFTTSDWNVLQTVTITAAADSLIEGDHTGIIAFSASSADPNYNGVLVGSLTAGIFDNDPANLQTLRTFNLNGDYVAAGIGLRGQTTGSINLTGIPTGSTVTAAYLYWSYIADNSQTPGLQDLTLAGTPLVGTLVGARPTPLPPGGYAPNEHSYNYRVDVTSLVAGNGVYAITGVVSGAQKRANGASLVVVYSNPLLPSRTVVLLDGNDTLDWGVPAAANIGGFTAPAQIDARTTFIVGDGQGLGRNATLTGGASTATFPNPFGSGAGNVWDNDTFNVSSAIASGDTSVSATISAANELVIWVAQVFSIGPTGVTITQTGAATDAAEGGATDTYTVALQSSPSVNVVITLSPDAQLSLSATTLTFTPANWNTPQTVTVTAFDDLANEGAHTGTLTFTVTSTDPGYNGLPLAALTANITDNDNVGVTVTPSGGATLLTEGGATDTFAVVLTIQPVANVLVTLNPGSQVSAAPTTLTFTSANWSTAQTVTLTAVDDFLTEGPHSGVVSSTITSADPRYNGFVAASVTASITDNDTAGVNLVQSGGTTNVTEGGATDTYTVVLNTSPTANVFVTLTTGAQVSVAAAVLTFTSANWNVVQTVTITAVDDASFEGPHTGVITHAVTSADPGYNAQPVPVVTANITDNDSVGVTQSGGSTDVSEAGLTDSYTLVLNSMPTANVVLTATPPGTLTTGSTTLTFTPGTWNVPQTVSVAAVDDLVYQGPHTGLVQHTVTSADPNYNVVPTPTVTVNIADNDSAGVTIAPATLSLTEGGVSGVYTVILTSQPTANVIIALTGSSLTLSAPTLTFTPATWNTAQTVTVTALDDTLAQGTHNGTVSHTAASGDSVYDAFAVATFTATITDDDVPGITLSSSSVSVLEGSTRSYTAVLDLPPVADVVLNFAPGALLTVSTAALTFNAANWNVPQAIVVTATDEALIQGNHAAIIAHSVTSADSAYNGLAVPALTANIIDNEGTVVQGTTSPDKIVVTNSPDLATVRVSVNGKVTTFSSAIPQLLISTFGGADSIQIFNPIVPIILVGGQASDSVLVSGQAGANAFTVGDSYLLANSVNVSLFEVENVVAAGSNAGDNFAVASTPLYNVECRGNLGDDHLLGSDRANTWDILNPNYGTLNANIKFTSVENLTGGTSTDGFVFRPGKSITGQLDGGPGSNVLNYSLCTAAIAVNLQTGKATGVSGFQNINQVVGGKNAADRLVGLDQVSNWNITDWNAGNVNGVTFANVENLTGGAFSDTFRLGDDRGVKGRIDGGGGSDALDYSSYLSKAISILLQTQRATNLGGFTALEQFVGGSARDTLIGANLTNAWNLSASNTGDVNGLGFAGFENLTGGIKNDAFNLSGAADWTGLLDGGVGLDTLTSASGAYVLTGTNAGSLNGRSFKNVERRF